MSKRVVSSYIWDNVESLLPRELQQLQLERLRAGVDRLSRTVPFYKNKLTEAWVAVDSIRSLEDLDRLPFTTKQDLRDNYPFGFVAIPMKEVVHLHASSGTTGKPTVVAYTRNDINLWSDLMARTCAVKLVGPREIARSEGKAVRVVDKRTI